MSAGAAAERNWLKIDSVFQNNTGEEGKKSKNKTNPQESVLAA